jgi:hypothetical protein
MATHLMSGDDLSMENLTGNLTSVRTKAFELVDGLDRAGQNSPELRAASQKMQSIANQLGALQASIRVDPGT